MPRIRLQGRPQTVEIMTAADLALPEEDRLLRAWRFVDTDLISTIAAGKTYKGRPRRAKFRPCPVTARRVLELRGVA